VKDPKHRDAMRCGAGRIHRLYWRKDAGRYSFSKIACPASSLQHRMANTPPAKPKTISNLNEHTDFKKLTWRVFHLELLSDDL